MTERRKQKSLKVWHARAFCPYRDVTFFSGTFSMQPAVINIRVDVSRFCASFHTQHALEQELSKKEVGQGAGLSVAAQRAYVDTLSESLSPHSKNHGPSRVDDVIRKNEVCHVLCIHARLYSVIHNLGNKGLSELSLFHMYVCMYECEAFALCS